MTFGAATYNQNLKLHPNDHMMLWQGAPVHASSIFGDKLYDRKPIFIFLLLYSISMVIFQKQSYTGM